MRARRGISPGWELNQRPGTSSAFLWYPLIMGPTMKNKDRHSQEFEPGRHASGCSGAGSRGSAIAVAIVFGLLAMTSPAQSQTQPQSQQKEEPAGDAAKTPQTYPG